MASAFMKFILICASAMISPLSCADTVLLPDPLSLEQALDLAQHHPRLAQAQASLNLAEADASYQQSQDNFNIKLEAQARWVELKNNPAFSGHNDHRGQIRATKSLYDAQLQATRQATMQTKSAKQHDFQTQQQQQQIEVMSLFFNILLADKAYQVVDEAMAIALIRFDRLGSRQKLGQSSDLALAEANFNYQTALQDRRKAEMEQRLSRERLANSLNQAGHLSSTLIRPKFNYLYSTLPDLESLIQTGLRQNPQLLSLKAQQQATRSHIQAARAARKPKVEAQLVWTEWQNQYGGARDSNRAILAVSLPLYTGGRIKTQIAQALANHDRVQADLQRYQLELREQISVYWFNIQHAQQNKAVLDSAEQWRDIKLDDSRSRYDMELQSDLGNSLVEQSRVALQQAEQVYQLALDWANLAALLAEPLPLSLPTKETQP